MAAQRPEERAGPECVVLGARAGTPASDKPPVRIFLGSEPAQHRAERIFVWSVERVRDPSRVYEIHIMKSLSGFRRRGWTTGFTNYRYAIPHFARGEGRAIYNDTDQIYLADPADLFDTDLGDHGFLAVAPDDTSVMVLDCARMLGVWALRDAQREHKSRMSERALRIPGLYGSLYAGWNARDGEYEAGRSRVLHYTNLHTQPWRPLPERYVYQHHRDEDLWFDLERSADAEGFQVYSRERPSEQFRALGTHPNLEEVPEDDLPWFLDGLLGADALRGPFEITCDAREATPRGPDGLSQPAHTSRWWIERIETAAAAHPGRRWEITLHTPDASEPVLRDGGPTSDGKPPRVWVLTDDRPGNSTQSVGLAEALGWPYETRKLRPGPLARLHNRWLGASLRGIDRNRSAPLEPPWPDLVIAAGRRTAPAAQWIRAQSRGRTRLVQLGRKGGDAADAFDLAVTPAYCALFPHPRRLETHTPLHAMTDARLAQAAEHWKERVEAVPAPHIAVLVGGDSGQYRLDPETAWRLGDDVARMARELGGSVLATTSRRTDRRATQAFCDALGDAASWVYRAGDAGENPYPAFLALADIFVVTGDSESMLAEATSRGRPVYIYPLPLRGRFRLERLVLDRITTSATAQPPGSRGTGRPQRGLQYWSARLIERGYVRPIRDLDRMHDDLIRRGVARSFGTAPSRQRTAPLRESSVVAARVRAMMGYPPF